jgi:hypothetical protein
MRKFNGTFAAFAVLSMSASVFTWNILHGSGTTVSGHNLTAPHAVLLAHGPTVPPDPRDGVRIAHGPTLPPDPWDGVRIAHGPTLPPDPWDGLSITA